MTKRRKEPQELTDRELGELLQHLPIVEAWIRAVYAAALESMLRGRRVPGIKLVRGRSSRYWSDDAKVAKLLAKTYKIDVNEFAPRKLVGVAKVEALLVRAGKAKRTKGVVAIPRPLAVLVGRTQAAIHIAPENDPRPAVQRGEEFTQATPPARSLRGA